MRALLAAAFSLSCLSSGVLTNSAYAETIEAYAPITKVTVHPQGATVTRKVDVALPAGDHVLVLPALFEDNVEFYELQVTGAQKGAVWVSGLESPLPKALEAPEVTAAREALESAEVGLQAIKDRQAELLLPKAEGSARLQFLAGLAKSDGATQLTAEQLKTLVRTVGSESRDATQMSQAAEIAARNLEDALEDAVYAVDSAELALVKQISLNASERVISVNLVAPVDTTAQIEVRYLSADASWYAYNEIYLERTAEPKAVVKRNVVIKQASDEAWRDVELILSTAAPLFASRPSNLYPQLRRIEKPKPVIEYNGSKSGTQHDLAFSEPMIEAPVIMEYSAMSSKYDGLAVEFHYPETVTVERSVDGLKLPLEDLDISVENLFAKAVPERDKTAFLMAELKNVSDAPLMLQGGATLLYLNGTVVGGAHNDDLRVGQTDTFAFGPIDGLQVASVVVDDNAGDRGIIRGSKIQTQKRRFDIENFTPESWDLRVFGRVPYSAQEDLEIEWSATPTPTEENADDNRGILRWDITLKPGEKREIMLDHQLTWPEEFELR
ncbi:MAG: DUF4139 domain-containing protein [Cognatishimia sp.]